jgi:hypothetical protein
MTETQAASGSAGASTNPAGAEGADGGDGAGGAATGRAVVGRATVPAETPPPKFTRPLGMVPPPDKVDGAEKPAGSEPVDEHDGSPAGGHPTGRASVSATARVATPPPVMPGAPTSGAAAGATTATTGLKTGTRPGGGTGRVSAIGGAKVAEAVRAARATVTSAASRGPRRARLFIKRIDPWSVMKFSFAVSFVLFFVAIVATSVLYLALDAMGVFRSLNKMLADMLGATGGKGTFKITALGVIGTAGVLGLVNVVLFTALATLGSFIYNVCADLVGGIEVTLSEKD